MSGPVLTLETEDGVYSVYILQEFGLSSVFLSKAKIIYLWKKISQYPVLFSDHTEGNIDSFLTLLFNPAATWFEVTRDGETVGLLYLTHVIPRFDAKGHFVVWERFNPTLVRLIHQMMKLVFDSYGLRRLSAEAPPYQPGLLRALEKRLGMVKEGVKREAVLYRDRWYPLIQFGLVRSELDEILKRYEGVQLLNVSNAEE